MDSRALLIALGVASSYALAQQPSDQPPPPEQPAQQQPAAPSDPYTELNKRVQEELRARGLYSGPVNGVIGPNTQAAIAQFQLSWPMPVHGMLDENTLAALGIQPPQGDPTVASSGASAPAEVKGN
jgi:peptidoglycan hydrolase-like protein with peptidoglycan-binding domain